jgi:translation initiation factor 2B subunit (eIF-2B alpha/beta/delta family)
MCGSVCVCVCAQRNAVVVMVIVGGYKFYKSDWKIGRFTTIALSV